MTEYVDRVVADFVAQYEGAEIDLTGAYGPQSPDLIAAYISALLGRNWDFDYLYAADLWRDAWGIMARDFERIEDGQFEVGDVLVFDRTHNGTGTVGVYLGPGDYDDLVGVFSRLPGRARRMNIRRSTLLGCYRLTAGAECVKAVDEYVAKLPKPEPTPQRPPSFFPPVWSAEAMLKLDAERGDIVNRDDNKTTHVCIGDPSTPEGWHEVRAVNLDDLNAPGVYRLPATAIGQQFGPNPIPQPIAWLSDGRPVYVGSTGRHYRREHWLKRLFLRGR